MTQEEILRTELYCMNILLLNTEYCMLGKAKITIGKAVCAFVLCLSIVIFASIVIQDGSIIVPCTVLLFLLLLLLYRWLYKSSTEAKDDEKDMLVAAVAIDDDRRKSRRANAALNHSRDRLSQGMDAVACKMAENSALPTGWEEFIDEASGNIFYYNDSTAETTWERPT